MKSTRALSIAAALVLAVSACASGSRTKSIHGTVGGYSMTNAHPKPLSLMVAQKIERPLYIVLDPAKVKDTWQLDTCANPGKGCGQFHLMDVQQFVRRDLKAAMANYFTRVEVIDAGEALPETPHIVADVKVDDIRLNFLVRGMLTHVIIEMSWGFAMRGNDQAEYAYSFAGTATSNDSYPNFEVGCAQMVENAIPAMLKKWTEDGGMAAMRDGKDSPSAAAAAAEAAS